MEIIWICYLPGDAVKPYISLFLLVLVIYVLFRFLFMFNPGREKKSIDLSRKQSILLGLVAGFADATGGGGWGPIATSVLLSKKGAVTRKVVGTVDTSEFAIAVFATIGFLISLGWENVNWHWVIALMLGGIIAAPIAAWLVRKLPSYLLGTLVGGFIILTNTRTLINTWLISDLWVLLIYIFISIIWITAIIFVTPILNLVQIKRLIVSYKHNVLKRWTSMETNREILTYKDNIYMQIE